MAAEETLDDNYAKAGYHARQHWGARPALLLIDFASAYFEPDSPLYGGEGCRRALESAARLLAKARTLSIPVIFTEVKYQAGGKDGGVFYRKAPPLACFQAGNALQVTMPEVAPHPDEIVVTKQYPSAFFSTSLASTLTHLGVDTVLLTGVTTSGCVRASCVDAMSHGFITLVVEDAVGDRDDRPHRANLYDMSAKYADLVSEAEAIDYLTRTQAKG
ncbi:MAG: isochorismatase family protein [Roseitalea sp.]|jgi:maleamate amidohydrolase|nr:isochorismatase family protein [Roseitalea sp.]MBO6741451.1 isochorismatase family protein [Roseitalea sp.]